MDTNQRARVSDQHPGRQDSIVNRSLRTRLTQEPNVTPRRLLGILGELSPQPPEELPCLNPECHKLCQYPQRGSRGYRPSRFCDKACRAKFERTRARLADELALIEEAAETHSWSKREHLDLQRQISLRRWALARYPAEM